LLNHSWILASDIRAATAVAASSQEEKSPTSIVPKDTFASNEPYTPAIHTASDDWHWVPGNDDTEFGEVAPSLSEVGVTDITDMHSRTARSSRAPMAGVESTGFDRRIQDTSTPSRNKRVAWSDEKVLCKGEEASKNVLPVDDTGAVSFLAGVTEINDESRGGL
jgi:hypothetical protein